MTLVCAPVKEWPERRPVDLYEVTERHCKFLYDSNKNLVFGDVDWEGRGKGEIVSYHNFEKTPDLEEVLLYMKRRHPKARYYKLATFAESTLDALRMLQFQKRHADVIGVCMGEKGKITRILAGVMGAPIVYAPLHEEEKNAPGQLLWSELSVIYGFKRWKVGSPIYGLIGDPVSQSVGHLFHNEKFLYVKMQVREEELAEFFELVKGLPFQGLSVTAPLKEKVMPFLGKVSEEARGIGAVNTLVRGPRGWAGYNTDGKAAADTLGVMQGKEVVVLGAGGAARAIIYELVRRGAKVTVVNRGHKRAEHLAHELGCKWAEEVPSCDVLVCATSGKDVPVLKQVPPVVMDVSVHESDFLKIARACGSKAVDGMEMYVRQALAQQKIWRGP